MREHVTEQDVIRLIDQQGSETERAFVRAHIVACSECRQLHDQLSVASGTVQRALNAAPVGYRVPPYRAAPRAASRAAWKLAAGIVFLAAGMAMALPAGRAWAEAMLARLRTPAAAPRVSEPAVIAARSGEAILVEVAPISTQLVVEFSAPRDDLSVMAHGGKAVVLRSALRAPVTVLPATLRIDNASVEPGAYTLQLPSGVSRVEVRVAGRRVAMVERSTLREGVRIPLR